MSVIDEARKRARERKTVYVSWSNVDTSDRAIFRVRVEVVGATTSETKGADARNEDGGVSITFDGVEGDWIARAQAWATNSTRYVWHEWTEWKDEAEGSTSTSIALNNWRIVGTA